MLRRLERRHPFDSKRRIAGGMQLRYVGEGSLAVRKTVTATKEFAIQEKWSIARKEAFIVGVESVTVVNNDNVFPCGHPAAM